jgi:hypothetical protein
MNRIRTEVTTSDHNDVGGVWGMGQLVGEVAGEAEGTLVEDGTRCKDRNNWEGIDNRA